MKVFCSCLQCLNCHFYQICSAIAWWEFSLKSPERGLPSIMTFLCGIMRMGEYRLIRTLIMLFYFIFPLMCNIAVCAGKWYYEVRKMCFLNIKWFKCVLEDVSVHNVGTLSIPEIQDVHWCVFVFLVSSGVMWRILMGSVKLFCQLDLSNLSQVSWFFCCALCSVQPQKMLRMLWIDCCHAWSVIT